MSIISRTFSKIPSPQNMSSHNIEIIEKGYETTSRKESFGNDSDNGFPDENPLLPSKPTYKGLLDFFNQTSP